MKYTEGRIIIKVDMEVKNSHKFEDGTIIKLERGWNNLNQRETQPVNGIVVSAKDIPEGAEVLCHHNCFHPSYQIFNHGKLSGSVIAGKINYYSIPEDQVFFWRDGDAWNPLEGYATGLRVFKPYKGILEGIEPTRIKDTLYITSGNLKGKICHTLKAADYCIVFQDVTGREGQLIRFRHSDVEDNPREELTCISGYLTKELEKGNILIGLTSRDAKTLKELVHA